MARIYYLMGKSATGKDTVYKELLRRFPQLQTVVPYTTRPVREGETDGVEYHFRTDDELEALKDEGRIIELRTYDTVMGPWNYFTVDDGQIDPEGDGKYLMIGTLESYEKMRDHFGSGILIPLYIEVPDGTRLKRAEKREEEQKEPNYREVLRRYLADEEDFSEENLARLGITKRFRNIDLETCLDDIAEVINTAI